MPKIELIQGDCLEKMKDIPDGSIDAIVTDPPYGLSFMGKNWDKGVPGVEFWIEMLRVLKHGGYLLSFSGTRTYHRMATAIEDAGFEIRDMIEWVYGSGFPKSLNIGKAVDKLQGNEREVVGEKQPSGMLRNGRSDKEMADKWSDQDRKENIDTKGTSEWEGWGTALKPAHEPICMARKPLSEKTVAENVLKWGTGGVNIDESRVGTEPAGWGGAAGFRNMAETQTTLSRGGDARPVSSRFPANLIHDNSEEVRECFPESGGGKFSKSGSRNLSGGSRAFGEFDQSVKNAPDNYGDSGNASRFFKSIQPELFPEEPPEPIEYKSIIYQAKASKAERNKGCEGLEEKQYSHDGRDKEIENPYQRNKSVATNNHPTVKPIALMEYLINMVTQEGGTVLDPFMGSGTTGVACKKLNRNFIGIELDPEYFKIAEKRINEKLIKELKDANR